MGHYSDFLFAQPSFLEGMARTLDIGGTLDVYNTSPSGDEADEAALLADWFAVGDSIRHQMREFAAENPEVAHVGIE